MSLKTEFSFSSERLFSGFRLRYNEHAALGAQTERLGLASAGEWSLAGYGLTGLFV